MLLSVKGDEMRTKCWLYLNILYVNDEHTALLIM